MNGSMILISHVYMPAASLTTYHQADSHGLDSRCIVCTRHDICMSLCLHREFHLLHS